MSDPRSRITKLGDLGTMRKIGERPIGYTDVYCPIDQVEAMLTGKGSHPSMDVYALGATMYRVLTGKGYNPYEVSTLIRTADDLYTKGSVRDALSTLVKARERYVSLYQTMDMSKVPQRFREVVRLTTHPDPSRRPNAMGVLRMLDSM